MDDLRKRAEELAEAFRCDISRNEFAADVLHPGLVVASRIASELTPATAAELLKDGCSQIEGYKGGNYRELNALLIELASRVRCLRSSEDESCPPQ
jgi:hypothetical protein